MKKALCILAMIAISSFTSGQVGKGSSEVKVEQVAKYRTDTQIDSVYRVADIRPVVDALTNNFGTLRRHMDSLNTVIIVSQINLAKESEKRGNAIIEMQKMSLENDRLRMDNESKEKQINIISQGTHILMMFVLMIAAIQFSRGIDRGLRKLKNECK